jgi:hypothetical protein
MRHSVAKKSKLKFDVEAAVNVVSMVHGHLISYFEIIDKTCQNEVAMLTEVNNVG